ncbi:hypothetical protein CF651_00605 [Paenibacillus rigui]|uniref:Response regulatory domain-containing protein n=2 Tax=Paenibacillus rigui TaxID=554312 RepID=A0A229UYF6_9BACL|nr:hypothetical protein CF651_00605 [Paenibacillus rigui]
MLADTGEVEVAGKFVNPLRGIEAVIQACPDVVFLDMDMPELGGIQVAERLLQSLPDLHIVFVTAYNDFAVQAFELQAVDYLLKPVRRERLLKTLKRLQKPAPPASREDTLPAEGEAPSLMIRLLRNLQFELSGQETLFIRWRTTKTQELFAYLFHHRNQPVHKDTLIELLWPELDYMKASTHLYTSVYQVRKTLASLKDYMRVCNGDEGYRLETTGVIVDSEEWEKGVVDAQAIGEENLAAHKALMDLYRGDYLQECDYWWAESERQRLKMLWLNHATALADYCFAAGETSEAISLYHKIQAWQPYVGHSYYQLMQMYDAMGNRPGVEEQFKSLASLLSSELNEAPEPHIVAWHEQWKRRNQGAPA